jgi:hypothetical protein
MSSGLNTQSSDFPTEANESYPSFQQKQAGPFGTTINGQIARAAELNVPFDQNQFEEAKQNGCMQSTCKAYPQWPPPYGTGFIYPSIQKGTQETLMGQERGCFPMAAAFIDSEPILPSVNMPAEEMGGEMYSPSNILNMYDCLNTPQPLSNKCFGYMPYDQTYLASIRGRGAEATGWLDDPLSPVPITSQKQPVAVKDNIPSQAASDRNNNFNQTAKPSRPLVETFLSGVKSPTQNQVPPNPTPSNPAPVQNPMMTNRPIATNPTTNKPQVRRIDVYEIDVEERDQYTDDHDNDKCDTVSFSTLFPCMIRSLRGFMRDLVTPSRQPEDQDTLEWLFRNNRIYYILTFMIIVVIVSIGAHSMCGSDSQHVVQLFCILVVAFLVYLALPRTHGQAELQKITSLFILSVAIWGILYKVK